MLNDKSHFFIYDWHIQPELLRIVAPDGQMHTLEPKIMDVLLFLAQRAQQVVSRDELMEQVWGDCIVVDDTLSRCISQLRKVFQDLPEKPAFIETIRSKGYRLLVAPSTSSVQADVGIPFRSVMNRYRWPAATACMLLLVFWVGWHAGFRATPVQEFAMKSGDFLPIFIDDDTTVHLLSLPDDENAFHFSPNDTTMKWIHDKAGE